MSAAGKMFFVFLFLVVPPTSAYRYDQLMRLAGKC